MKLDWYLKRFAGMGPAEVARRARDAGRKTVWRTSRGARAGVDAEIAPGGRCFAALLPRSAGAAASAVSRQRLEQAAEAILAGSWPVFDRTWKAVPEPDWFRDPRSGIRAPSDDYCFSIRYRDEERIGNVKYVWEPSRHHHLTVLAAAYRLTGDPRYAERVARHLRSWWRENPFLRGIHWVSGIEVGMRLIAWSWIRRLLGEWPDVAALFEDDRLFLGQLADHQRYLAALPSYGSSANNHLIAEAAGRFVAACALPFLRRSATWAEQARRTLQHEIRAQTYPDGLNRELATEYHGYVLELSLVAALEGEAAGMPLGEAVWATIRNMTDALAAVLDAGGRPPRQGDGDEASGLLLDHPAYDRWGALLATGRELFGAAAWWPPVPEPDVRTALWTALARPPDLDAARAPARPDLFPAAGLCFLRSGHGANEIWCRCDHGPLGYLSTAAHGHADALSLEVRVGGVELLVDPGTYCYHGEPRWRAFFRSTIAHATLEVAGCDQSTQAGPFLWWRPARTRLREVAGLGEGPVARWSAEHDGYTRLRPPVVHRRAVMLDRVRRSLTIRDALVGRGMHPVRLVFPLGPRIEVTLDGSVARLLWPGGEARLELPGALDWDTVRGREDPPLGWYAAGFDRKAPATTLVGSGLVGCDAELVSRLWIGGPSGGVGRPGGRGML